MTDFGGTTYTYGYGFSAQLESIGDGTNTYASGATYQYGGALATLTQQLTSGSTSYTRSITPNSLLEPTVIRVPDFFSHYSIFQVNLSLQLRF